MNEISNQYSISKLTRITCLALGFVLAFVCQESAGQLAPSPPKISPKLAGIQAELVELKKMKENFPGLIEAEQAKQKTYEQELEELRKRKSTLKVSAESYPEILKTIHSQRIQLSIDLAGLEARRDALVLAIGNATVKRDKEVLNPYKRLVQVREAELQRSQSLREKGSAGSKEIQNAEVELLEARLRLAEASKPSGSVTYLNSQLLDTSLERAEKTARLDKVASILKDVDEYQTFQEALNENDRNRKRTAMQLREVLNSQKSNKKRIAQYEEYITKTKQQLEERAE